jgi:hypothetical protein
MAQNSTRKRLNARMTESSFSPISLPKLRFFAELHQGNTRKHDLSDTIAVLDAKGRRSQIGKDHSERPAIVAVDRSRSVQHGYAMPKRQTGPRPDLSLHPPGHGQGQARGHEDDPPRLQNERLIQAGRQIESGRACRGPLRSPGTRMQTLVPDRGRCRFHTGA